MASHTLESLLDQLKSRRTEDYAHAYRVHRITDILATADERLSGRERSLLSTAAWLHDIGTLAIGTDILFRNGRLDFEQYETIQTHPALAENLVSDLPDGPELAKLIRHHHENINGFGYPDGLKGEAIPVGSRILHVAEALDSMVKRRNGGMTYTVPGALSELQKYAGRMYDATVVTLVSTHLDDIQAVFDEGDPQ